LNSFVLGVAQIAALSFEDGDSPFADSFHLAQFALHWLASRYPRGVTGVGMSASWLAIVAPASST